jgi:hypothetical protein
MRTVFLLSSLLFLSLGCSEDINFNIDDETDTDDPGVVDPDGPGGPNNPDPNRPNPGGPGGPGGPDRPHPGGPGSPSGPVRPGGGYENPNAFNPENENIDWASRDEETRNACHPDNLREVDIQKRFDPQIAMGLPAGFKGHYSDMQRGATHGLMGLEAQRNIAFVAWQHSGAAINNLEGLIGLMQGHAERLSAQDMIYAPFISWDAPLTGANALRVTFQLSGSMSPAARGNTIATSLLGGGSGSLAVNVPGATAAGATQYVRAQYVLRENGEVIVVMAVALNSDSLNGSPGFFGLADVAGGAALARYYDRTSARCEPSVVARRMVDFLFVVDDSASMRRSQEQLGAAGAAVAQVLNNSTLDWRVALVTSTYHSGNASSSQRANRGIIRGFTKDTQLIRAWLTRGSTCTPVSTCRSSWTDNNAPCANTTGANNGCWVDVKGDTSEGMLGAARLALMDMNRPNADAKVKLRKGADVVVVILTDTEDQTRSLYRSGGSSQWEPINHFVNFFQGKASFAKPAYNSRPAAYITLPPVIAEGFVIPVHAVYCPAGQNCGDSTVPRGVPTRIQRVAEETGGFVADIQTRRRNNNIAANDTLIPNFMASVVDSIIGRAGVYTDRPFIGASMRVAIQNSVGECAKADVPRSRQNGFDYDGIAQTVAFFGNCRPDPDKDSRIAISYRSWDSVERSPCEDDENFEWETGECKGRLVCDIATETCICPPQCGGCPPEASICDMGACVCYRID